MIEVDGLTKRYGDKTAVDGLRFGGAGRGHRVPRPERGGEVHHDAGDRGLDGPTSGTVRVNGKHYPDAAAPMSELGILLDARSVHPGVGPQQPAGAGADRRYWPPPGG